MVFDEKYDCIYSAEGESVPERPNDAISHFSVDLRHHACFGQVYGKIKLYKKSRVTYHVYLFKENLEGKNYNLCDKMETKKILRCLQKTVPFTYNFTSATFTESEYSRKQTEFSVLNITMEGNPCQHIWITSMLRCFFEWPYNVAAKEACELQSNIKEADGIDFSTINWINLYLTIAALLGSTSLHGVVSFSSSPKLRNYHDWKQLLEKSTSKYVYDVINKGHKSFSATVKQHPIKSQRSFDSKQDREIRVKNYVAAYKDKKSWKK